MVRWCNICIILFEFNNIYLLYTKNDSEQRRYQPRIFYIVLILLLAISNNRKDELIYAKQL